MNLIFRYMYIYIGEYGKIEIAAAAIFITGNIAGEVCLA